MQGVVLREVVLDTGEEFVLKGGFHVGAWARGGSDDVVGGVVGAEGGCKVLGANHGKVVLHWEEVGLLVEVAEGGFFGGSSADAEGLVLNGLELKDVGFGKAWEPDWSGIGKDGTNEGFVGEKEVFFLVTPGRPCQALEDVEAGGCFGGNVFGVLGEGMKGVKSDT